MKKALLVLVAVGLCAGCDISDPFDFEGKPSVQMNNSQMTQTSTIITGNENTTSRDNTTQTPVE